MVVSGNRDTPGFARLERFHPSLDVGNEVAAAHAASRRRSYAVVLSTVTPRNSSPPYAEDPSLTTLEFKWHDQCGRETPAGEAVAKRKIVEAARALDEAISSLSDGERVLVHCAWGQNRSNAICVAWACLFRKWTPQAAVAYAKAACCDQRRYANPRPLHNDVFVNILMTLVPATDGRLAPPSSGLTAWMKRKAPDDDPAS
ncbi:hypothetical protein CTAYLR_007658 [Chrysophaeum taylorii]|uniref:Tyrosine specific protein phosphatases domain-containing protein n=1 Tax=Chrysophaeum taylorii TaxID=2483200 RepID=A0AAD7U7C5_9STRA|nr:hypothetical protein CTAYLR_007658 [Chrysophaeum taylorii]